MTVQVPGTDPNRDTLAIIVEDVYDEQNLRVEGNTTAHWLLWNLPLSTHGDELQGAWKQDQHLHHEGEHLAPALSGSLLQALDEGSLSGSSSSSGGNSSSSGSGSSGGGSSGGGSGAMELVITLSGDSFVPFTEYNGTAALVGGASASAALLNSSSNVTGLANATAIYDAATLARLLFRANQILREATRSPEAEAELMERVSGAGQSFGLGVLTGTLHTAPGHPQS